MGLMAVAATVSKDRIQLVGRLFNPQEPKVWGAELTEIDAVTTCGRCLY